MITISLCMIVRDAEETLEACLESVGKIADEIIIVDTGSRDNTKEIALKFTDKVYDMVWEDDFATARNKSFEYATQEYILWLDADDVIEKKEQQKFLALKELLDERVDMVMMNYHVQYDKKGNLILSYYRERLVKQSSGWKWVEPVHEMLQVEGRMMYSDIYIVHKGNKKSKGRNLKIYQHYLDDGGVLSTRGKLYYARELYDSGDYRRARDEFLKFLEEEDEDAQGCANACLMVGYCNKVLEEECIAILYRSFKYSMPRKEICCEIGDYFASRKLYDKAIFWYELTLKLPLPAYGISAQYHEYEGYLPHLGLCVCYAMLDQKERARYHNEEAGKHKPNDENVTSNRKILR